ncbi:MAG: hypothetical protein HY060_20200 [Proteobacteria bacterium]|nr:hypothetical protein [Pseudomonadota bacterium]
MNAVRFALLGAVAGGLSAGAVYIPVGELPGFELFGLCVGVRVQQSCGGFSLAVYGFPGLVFGVVFGLAFWRLGLLRRSGATGFAVGAMVAYVVAVVGALMAMDAFGASQPALAAIGAGAGLVGGGLLAGVAVPLLRIDGWVQLAVTGAILGLMLPLWEGQLGMIVFYVVWQAGYALMLATALPRARLP